MERVTFDQLPELLMEVNRKLDILLSERSEQKKKLYTRQEVREILGVSNPTIISYEKRKLLSGSRIGHKCYYTWEDVETALSKIKKDKS